MKQLLRTIPHTPPGRNTVSIRTGLSAQKIQFLHAMFSKLKVSPIVMWMVEFNDMPCPRFRSCSCLPLVKKQIRETSGPVACNLGTLSSKTIDLSSTSNWIMNPFSIIGCKLLDHLSKALIPTYFCVLLSVIFSVHGGRRITKG